MEGWKRMSRWSGRGNSGQTAAMLAQADQWLRLFEPLLRNGRADPPNVELDGRYAYWIRKR